MVRLFPRNVDVCVPLTISDGNSSYCSRIGGPPPTGIAPRNVSPMTRYLATIRVGQHPIVEISLFLSFDFYLMAENAGVIHSGDRFVQVLIHAESIRSSTSEIASDLSPHPITHRNEIDDWLVDDDGSRVILAHHKLGGRPYIQGAGAAPTACRHSETPNGMDILRCYRLRFLMRRTRILTAIGGKFADGFFHLLVLLAPPLGLVPVLKNELAILPAGQSFSGG